MRPKFDNSSISIREVIITSVLWGFDQQKTNFFEGWSRLQLNNLGQVLGMSWKVYTSVAKGLKLELKKCLGLVPTFVEVKGELGLTHKSKNWMKRATLSKTKLRNLSCGFIYSMINYGSTEHDIILLIKASPSVTRISSLRVSVHNKMRENSITLGTKNWIFRSSSLFQSNCTNRSN